MLHSLKRFRCALSVVAALMLAAGSAFAQADATNEQINAGPPPKDLPSVPGWGYLGKPDVWLNWHNGNVQISAKGGIEVVFIGDSLTWGWSNSGKAVWEKNFAPLKAVNYAIGGDTTRQILWRLGHGTLDGLKPNAKLIVLMIGTNNLYNDNNSGTNEQIADGVKAILDLLKEKSPDSKVLLLGVLPRQNKYFCDRAIAINDILSTFADSRVKYLNVSEGFADAAGVINKDFFTPDLVHLSTKGYEHMATTLKPAVDAMLK